MAASRTKFYLDKQDGKFLGVCAGIGDYTGVDSLWVRIGFVALTLFAFPPLFFMYFVVAFLAEKKPYGLYDTPEDKKFWQGVRSNPKRTTAEVRSKLRDIDRRLADMETFYTSRNTQLAEEIERLR